MVQVYEKLEALADDAVGFLTFDVGDKAHAARVMLMPRIVKTLFRRQRHCQTPEFPYFSAPKPAHPIQDKEKTGLSLLFAHLRSGDQLQRGMTVAPQLPHLTLGGDEII
jgi:hypothetical protein